MNETDKKLESREVVISCAGFELEGFLIPPFQLHTGEVVSLEWPPLGSSSTEQHLIQIFTGEIAHEAVRLRAVTHQVRPYGLRLVLLGSERLAALFHPLGIPFISKYLSWLPWGYTISREVVEKGTHSSRVAVPKSVVRDVAEKQDMHRLHLHGHGFNVCTAVTWAMTPRHIDLLVFHTGASNLQYQYLESLLQHAAAIEISWEVTRMSPPKKWYAHYPDAQVLKVKVMTQ